jgi:hypothetical protein
MSDNSERTTLLPYHIGYCIAMKSLAREGARVGYMYRERPEESGDSGWRFFRGDETEEEANEPDNLALYDVETIAGCDPAVIARLHSPYGSAWDRVAGKDVFEAAAPVGDGAAGGPPSDDEPPLFPSVSGPFDLPGQWRCRLPVYFFIRPDDGELVIWREKLTMRFRFLVAAKRKLTKEEALERNKRSRSPDAAAEREEVTGDMVRYSYEVPAAHDPQGCTTLVGNLFSDDQWLLSTCQCDDEEAIGWARAVRASIDLVRS